MKKIGIDARLYSQTGVGTYIDNFLFYLDKRNDSNFLYYVYLNKDDFNKVKFDSKNIIKRKTSFHWHSLAEQVGFLFCLVKEKLDLMHFTYFSYPVFYPRKFVATVHDLTPLFFKTGRSSTKSSFVYKLKYTAFSFALKNQIEKAEAIITPSLATKNQIIAFYGDKYEKKIFPIPEGIDYQLFQNFGWKVLKKKFNFKFFIYVGNFYPHKNVERLIEAFLRIKKPIKLILIGPDDFFAKKMQKLIKSFRLGKKILIYHPKIKSELAFFYRNAQALIHPSLSEGFGLPLLEAAYFGCPIIASNIEVFKEIMEKEYLPFDPYDSQNIAEQINFFLQKKPKFNYKKIIQKYSFKKMTEEILKIYQKVIK